MGGLVYILHSIEIAQVYLCSVWCTCINRLHMQMDGWSVFATLYIFDTWVGLSIFTLMENVQKCIHPPTRVILECELRLGSS